jgi:uncharacterized protein (DUF1499 family)
MKDGKMVLPLTIASLAGIIGFFGYRSYKAQTEHPQFHGEILPCEGKPNCISTSGPKTHLGESWQLKGDFQAIKRVILEKNPEVVIDTEFFIHVVFKSKLFKYPDDFALKCVGKDIFYRSSSRVGHSDLGVNKKRIELFQEELRQLNLIH